MKEIIKYVVITLIIIVGVVLVVFIYNDEEKNEELVTINDITVSTTIINQSKFFVDIKGAVKRPGVYLVEEGTIVNDVIKLAGGLKSNATTKNINLSQLVKKEMVIYVYTKNEITKQKVEQINDVTCTTNIIEIKENIPNEVTTQEQNKLVNINTASKEELMSLPNIGSSKADSIIIYRKDNKFNTIEDIMKVSGIGESYFEKIKDYITV